MERQEVKINERNTVWDYKSSSQVTQRSAIGSQTFGGAKKKIHKKVEKRELWEKEQRQKKDPVR